MTLFSLIKNQNHYTLVNFWLKDELFVIVIGKVDLVGASGIPLLNMAMSGALI